MRRGREGMSAHQKGPPNIWMDIHSSLVTTSIPAQWVRENEKKQQVQVSHDTRALSL